MVGVTYKLARCPCNQSSVCLSWTKGIRDGAHAIALPNCDASQMGSCIVSSAK